MRGGARETLETHDRDERSDGKQMIHEALFARCPATSAAAAGDVGCHGKQRIAADTSIAMNGRAEFFSRRSGADVLDGSGKRNDGRAVGVAGT